MAENQAQPERSGLLAALGMAWQLGYTIAIPIVLLALGGRLLDRRFATSPLFLLLGVTLSVIATSIALWRKARRMLAEIERSEKHSDIREDS